MWKPELLSPAGSLDKLKVAVSYGADAVYCAGQKFGLRTAAENFTLQELDEGVHFAHERKAKVFLVLNGFLHDQDLEELPLFVKEVSRLGVDAVIASDLGVIRTVQENSSLPIHLSTQASCLNLSAAQMWKKMGVQRLILGREVSIEAAGRIKEITGLEVELFIHGSMCMAYSGNCTISNYTQGRDSNRGGCAQSCRFRYSLEIEEAAGLPHSVKDVFYMSSKDLNGLDALGHFFKYKIDSLKIEGRMRSPLYAGLTSKTYREAIDSFAHQKIWSEHHLRKLQKDLADLPHRSYTQASLIEKAGPESIHNQANKQTKDSPFVGLVKKVVPGQFVLVDVKAAFQASDPLEWVSLVGENLAVAGPLHNSVGEVIERANPNMLVRLPFVSVLEVGQILKSEC